MINIAYWILLILILGSCQRESIQPPTLVQNRCMISPLHPDQPWWVGAWQIDRSMIDQPIMISSTKDEIWQNFINSVSQSFSLDITENTASLFINHTVKRLIPNPQQDLEGVELVHTNERSTLWCEGSVVFWGVDIAYPLPLKRSPFKVHVVNEYDPQKQTSNQISPKDTLLPLDQRSLKVNTTTAISPPAGGNQRE